MRCEKGKPVVSQGRKATDLLKEADELPNRVGKGPFEPLRKDKKMRFDSKGSYPSASFINTPVRTQDFVPVALRQLVAKVLCQDYRRTKGLSK